MLSYYRPFIFFALMVSLFSGLMGAGIAMNITPKQNVVKVLETKVEIKEVVAKGCSNGQSGIVQGVFTEKINLRDKEDPQRWTWESAVSFKVGNQGFVCLFEGPELSKILKVGDNFTPRGGKPV